MNTARSVMSGAALAAAAAMLAGCMSGGPQAAAPAVDGEWMSTDGVALSRFSGGAFETVARDTGNKLASGSYTMVDARTVSITGTSLIRQSPISFNCLMAQPTQLNCTSSAGQTFALIKRPAVS